MTRTGLDVGRLLGIAAHDLRGPLGVLTGYTAMLGRPQGRELDDSQREMVEAIQRSARLLARIADSLTALANLEQGSWSPTRVDTSVAEWLTAVTAAPDRSLTLRADPGTETRVAVDPVLLQRALEALFEELDDGVSSPTPLVIVVSTPADPERVRLRIGRRSHIEAVDREEATKQMAGGRESVAGLLAARIVDAHGGRLARRADDVFVIDLPAIA